MRSAEYTANNLNQYTGWGRVRLLKEIQGDKRFVMSNHFVKGFAVGFGLGVILMVVAVVSYFS